MERCNLSVRVQNTNNATIKLNGEVKSSISVPKGSAVSIEITADGFETYIGEAVKNMKPVCSNCHRMLHRGENTLTVTELRNII